MNIAKLRKDLEQAALELKALEDRSIVSKSKALERCAEVDRIEQRAKLRKDLEQTAADDEFFGLKELIRRQKIAENIEGAPDWEDFL